MSQTVIWNNLTCLSVVMDDYSSEARWWFRCFALTNLNYLVILKELIENAIVLLLKFPEKKTKHSLI